MVLAELRQLAGELNIPDIAGMRKGELIAAIKEKQGAPPSRKRSADAQPTLPGTGDEPAAPVSTEAPAVNGSAPAADTPAADAPAADTAPAAAPTRRRRAASRPAGAPSTVNGAAVADAAPQAATADPAPVAEPAPTADKAPAEGGTEKVAEKAAQNDTGPEATDTAAPPRRSRQSRRNRAEQQSEQQPEQAQQPAEAASPAPVADQRDGGRDGADTRSDNRREGGRGGRDRDSNRDGRDGNRDNRGDRPDNRADRGDRADNRADNRDNRGDRPDNRADNRSDSRGPRDNRPDDDGDDDGDGRGRRGRRFRDRRRGRDRDRSSGSSGGGQGNVDTEVRDGDVLLPVAGIVDILDNYAFVRTTGYLSGPTDVYVSLSMVRKYGLRRGDAITGAVREAREGEQSRQKFNPLVRVDSINGQDPETSKQRPEFTKLTPLYPNERLRLETEPHKLTTRVIDLVMPVGKGQRALIVSPPKAGKTTIMQNIANAITTNNPECHLMVVLVDERPEEVTDMQRSVKGEVIASTFDRPPTDHTTIAELSIERAKRLVELGHDVVVLLDNITRLGRAYNLAAPASGRILSGGVDSTALYPPKRFLGAARNIEDGGSLTIFATALVETGSTMDTVIFEEFKGTGNAELKLDRKIADKRVFPAIDVGDSSTRKDELLMSPDEYGVMVKLRRVLSALDDQQAIDLLLTQLRKTRTNIEFLMQVAKSTPGADND
ncbi:transcription termination factor Rho [Pseudonocardia sp. DSM 110487]|nr:transcription termination factor Rho [Pseudonocardia sp. DSM 110487]